MLLLACLLGVRGSSLKVRYTFYYWLGKNRLLCTLRQGSGEIYTFDHHIFKVVVKARALLDQGFSNICQPNKVEKRTLGRMNGRQQ